LLITYHIYFQKTSSYITPVKNKKIALCVSGQIRDFAKCYPSWVRNLDMNNIDVFACVGGDDNSINYFKEKLNPIKIINCKKMPSDHKHINNNLRNELKNMWYRIYEVNKLKREYEEYNNFKYDVVIRIRPDLLLFSNIPIELSYLSDKIYIPKYSGSNVIFKLFKVNNFLGFGLCDQLSFGNSKIMDIYSDLYLYLEEKIFSDLKCKLPEKYLKVYLKMKNINYNFFPIDFFIYLYYNNYYAIFKRGFVDKILNGDFILQKDCVI